MSGELRLDKRGFNFLLESDSISASEPSAFVSGFLLALFFCDISVAAQSSWEKNSAKQKTIFREKRLMTVMV